MAIYNRITDEGRRKQGRGRGRGNSYIPWVQIGDFRGSGVPSFYPCLKTGRVAHNLSELEGAVRLLQSARMEVVDLRENYRLALSATLAAARALQVPHPRCRKTGRFVVMQVDLFSDIRSPGGLTFHEGHQVTIKRRLSQRSVMNKIRIVQLVLSSFAVPLWVWTEEDVNQDLVDNYERLRVHDDLSAFPGIDANLVERLEPVLFDRLSRSQWPLSVDCQIIDGELGLVKNTCLTIAYHLIWHGRWKVDLTRLLNPESDPLVFLGRCSESPVKLIARRTA